MKCIPVGSEGTGEDGAARGVGGVDVGAGVEGVAYGVGDAFGGGLEEGKVFKGAVWATHSGRQGSREWGGDKDGRAGYK